MQLSKQLNLPYREGFIKNRYIGRTFIMPGQAIRRKSVRQKLNAIGMEFKGKNVLLVDDSIVRGTTSREIVQMAREAGARRVFFASAAPPVRFPNVYGIDMPSPGELIATGRTDAEIAREIGCCCVVSGRYRTFPFRSKSRNDGNGTPAATASASRVPACICFARSAQSPWANEASTFRTLKNSGM